MPDTPRQHTQQIELDHRRELAVVDAHGIALESRRTRGDLDPGRTFRILWRPVPRGWQVPPDTEVRSGQA